MIQIQVNKDWRITSDQYQYILQKYSGINKETGDQVWANRYYYRTLADLATSLHGQLLRESDARTLKELENDAKAISGHLKRVFEYERSSQINR